MTNYLAGNRQATSPEFPPLPIPILPVILISNQEKRERLLEACYLDRACYSPTWSFPLISQREAEDLPEARSFCCVIPGCFGSTLERVFTHCLHTAPSEAPRPYYLSVNVWLPTQILDPLQMIAKAATFLTPAALATVVPFGLLLHRIVSTSGSQSLPEESCPAVALCQAVLEKEFLPWTGS
jgi:hypothetical protein